MLILCALALEDDIPITDPHFYSSETLCPDSLIEHIFRPAKQSSEPLPLLRERIAIMREVGFILCNVRGFIISFRNSNSNEDPRALVDPIRDSLTNSGDVTITLERHWDLSSWLQTHSHLSGTRSIMKAGKVQNLITLSTLLT